MADTNSTVKIGGKLYRLYDIYKRDIYASATGINLYSAPYLTSEEKQRFLIGRITGGKLAGKVFAHVDRPNGTWLMLDNMFKAVPGVFYGRPYLYVPADDVSAKDLSQQGVITSEEKRQQEAEAQAEENKSFFDKSIDTVKPILWIGLASIIGLQFFKASKYSK